MFVKGGLLSCGFGHTLDKVNNADPELTTSSGLYVYLWICGIDIKGGFMVALICSTPWYYRGKVQFHIQGFWSGEGFK